MPVPNPTLAIARSCGLRKMTYHEGEWKHTILHRAMQTADMPDGSCVYLIPRRASRRVTAHWVDCYHAPTGVQLAVCHEENQRYAMAKARDRIRQWQDHPETYREDVNLAVAKCASRYRLHGDKSNPPPRFLQYLRDGGAIPSLQPL